ncbi:MAG: NADH-quinone oxidoreductase subunit NuoE [Oscillospiraceae bacterium]|nr:NADH-quinone oxidoreductase subunit NuoE [Oscillospiraceae bacterium]
MTEYISDLSKLDKVFEEYENLPENLISVLQKSQEIYGFLPRDVIYHVAEKLGVTPAKVMGVATFYSQFRLEPMGKYLVMACGGTACHVNGSEKITAAISEYLGIKSGMTTPDGLFTFEKVACLGCCSLAPVIMINGEAYGNLTQEKAVAILENLRKKEAEK